MDLRELIFGREENNDGWDVATESSYDDSDSTDNSSTSSGDETDDSENESRFERRDILSLAAAGVTAAYLGRQLESERRLTAPEVAQQGSLSSVLSSSLVYRDLQLDGTVATVEYEPNPKVETLSDGTEVTRQATPMRFDIGYLGQEIYSSESERSEIPKYKWRETYPNPSPGSSMSHVFDELQPGWYRVGTKVSVPAENIADSWVDIDFRVQQMDGGEWGIKPDWAVLIEYF